MDTIASLRVRLTQLESRVRQLVAGGATVDARQTQALLAMGARSQRFGMLIEALAVGFTPQPILWPDEFPDDKYLVIPVVVVPNAQLGQVSIQAGAKTATGCTLVIRNTSAVTPACVVDVLAIRT